MLCCLERFCSMISNSGRTFAEFLKESEDHGWPSFRDEEVVWDHVRVLKDGAIRLAESATLSLQQLTECIYHVSVQYFSHVAGEACSVDGTHLGHNLPDHKGNRYCINLVSCAGTPSSGGQ